MTAIDAFVDRPNHLNVLHIPHPGITSIVLGQPSAVSGQSAVMSIRAAVALALQGRAAAVVTGPVSKESLKLSGIPHPGHTELLQALTGAKRVEMLMVAGPLRGLLITRHIPLKEVPSTITIHGIVEAVKLADPWLRRLLNRRPRWAILGLNPHAGDNGLLGSEEKKVVAPAITRLKALGLLVEGPLPADVAWARHAAGDFDVCACLYHDQGMVPLKTLSPKKLVNITIGLPLSRTSPGHGTAFDLSGGRYRGADPSATITASHMALDGAMKSVYPSIR